MEKQKLKQQLVKKHNTFSDYVLSLNEGDFNFALPEKWNAGQHLQHILISVSRLAKAFDNPKYVISTEEAELKREGMSYDALVALYLEFIKKGAKASAPFVPELVTIRQRTQLVKDMQAAVDELCLKLDKYTEQQLDELTIPHPLLGRITLREMIYFTIKHAEHHYELTKQYLQ
ncbi:MAG TPA: DinB family protein [Bacteroidia bacterium]|nr:DinB family protein [Bacteroidia bacterium]